MLSERHSRYRIGTQKGDLGWMEILGSPSTWWHLGPRALRVQREWRGGPGTWLGSTPTFTVLWRNCPELRSLRKKEQSQEEPGLELESQGPAERTQVSVSSRVQC